jgi:hypothetical protein
MSGRPWRIRHFIVGALFATAVAWVWMATVPRGWADKNSQCRNNLKQIGLALQIYHDQWGAFPPAYVADDKGRPIHSWRTLILPCLEQTTLYNQYRFDEPWDGPNNAEVCKRFPSSAMPFSCPADPNYGHPQTNYLAVVGPNTAWPGSRSAQLGTDFPDGAASTVLLIEVERSGIHWMEPRDLNFDEMSFKLNDPAGKSISSRHAEAGRWPWCQWRRTKRQLGGVIGTKPPGVGGGLKRYHFRGASGTTARAHDRGIGSHG